MNFPHTGQKSSLVMSVAVAQGRRMNSTILSLNLLLFYFCYEKHLNKLIWQPSVENKLIYCKVYICSISSITLSCCSNKHQLLHSILYKYFAVKPLCWSMLWLMLLCWLPATVPIPLQLFLWWCNGLDVWPAQLSGGLVAKLKLSRLMHVYNGI